MIRYTSALCAFCFLAINAPIKSALAQIDGQDFYNESETQDFDYYPENYEQYNSEEPMGNSDRFLDEDAFQDYEYYDEGLIDEQMDEGWGEEQSPSDYGDPNNLDQPFDTMDPIDDF